MSRLAHGGRLQHLRNAEQGFRVRRSVTASQPGLLRIRQRIVARAARLGTDVTGPYWVFAVVAVRRGEVRYVRDSGLVCPPTPSFAVFIPPWSVVQARLASCALAVDAFASSAPPPEQAPGHATAWPWPGARLLVDVDEVRHALGAAGGGLAVARASCPSPTAERTKRLIDATYRTPGRLADLAARARITPAAMSRSFKRTFGMPPVEYRHRLRVMEAVFRLAAGERILPALGKVGFGDVSRSYHHFRSLLCSSPGQYAVFRSRTTKT